MGRSASLAHPRAELLGRYLAVLRAAWAGRRELAGPRRLSDEAAFLPAALSLQETPVHPAPRRAALLIVALFLIALLWSVLGRIDIVAVAPGRIVVGERTKLVQPLETSVVQRVLVKDGDVVEAGQVLIELDPTAASADQSSLDQQLASETSERLRTEALLRALRQGSAPRLATGADRATALQGSALAEAQARLQAEWADIQARRARHEAEVQTRRAEIATVQAAIDKLDSTLPLSRQREADFKGLSAQGFIAGHAGQDKTRERVELERDLGMQQARLAQARAAQSESENAKAAFLAETAHTLSERQAQAALKLGQLTQEVAKATQRARLTTLTAPTAGTVQQLAVHTAGGVVTEAQALMVIVPRDADVTAEVSIDNKDIGFVQAGQTAEIKLETFPFTRYGTVQATVKTVSADAVVHEARDPGGRPPGATFPATLTLAQRSLDVEGKRIALSPGMNVTAEIKTGRRRVIDFLLSPVQDAAGSAMRER